MKRERERRREETDWDWRQFWKPQSPSPVTHLLKQGHTHSNLAIPLSPSQIVCQLGTKHSNIRDYVAIHFHTTTVHMYRPEDNLEEHNLSSTMWIQGVGLRSSGLTANIFTYWRDFFWLLLSFLIINKKYCIKRVNAIYCLFISETKHNLKRIFVLKSGPRYSVALWRFIS